MAKMRVHELAKELNTTRQGYHRIPAGAGAGCKSARELCGRRCDRLGEETLCPAGGSEGGRKTGKHRKDDTGGKIGSIE